MCKKEPYDRVQSNASLKKSQLIRFILGLSPWPPPKAGFVLILDAQIHHQGSPIRIPRMQLGPTEPAAAATQTSEEV